MLIYCNGDSFTAGVHLNDQMFPGFPGWFKNKKEIEQRQHEIKKFEEVKRSYLDLYVDHLKIVNNEDLVFYNNDAEGRVLFLGWQNVVEKKLAFPSELERLDSSIKTINSAIPGASMGGIVFRTILDLLTLKASGTPVDKVIIQLTSTNRYEIYNHLEPRLFLDRPIGAFRSKLDIDISNAILSKYVREDYFIRYLFHLMILQENVKSIVGSYPIMIDSMNGEHLHHDILLTRNAINNHIEKNRTDTVNIDMFNSLLEFSRIRDVKYNFMLDIANSLERPYAWDGHFSLDVHKVAAKQILDLL